MDVLKTLRLFRAYEGTLLALVISALVASVGVTYVVDSQYQSTTLILVQPHETLRLEHERPDKEILKYPVSQLAPIDAPSRTYMEVIRSPALAEQLVRALSLDKQTRPPAATALKELWARAKERLRDVMDDTWQLLKYGTVKDTDPLAAAVRRVQKNLALKATKDTYLFEITFTSADPEEAASVANRSAEIFVQYMTAAARSEARTNRIFLESRLQATEGQVAQARRALRDFKDQHATFALQDEYTSRLRTIADLERDLEQSEAHLAGALREYTPANPKVESMVAERDRLKESLDRLRGLRTALPAKETWLEDLTLRLRVAEGNYSAVNKALTETRFQEASQANDIRVVSPAVPPTYPAKPIKVYYAAGAVAVALLVGVGAVLLQESFWSRVRNTDDAERLGLRVLATIPQILPRRDA